MNTGRLDYFPPGHKGIEPNGETRPGPTPLRCNGSQRLGTLLSSTGKMTPIGKQIQPIFIVNYWQTLGGDLECKTGS